MRVTNPVLSNSSLEIARSISTELEYPKAVTVGKSDKNDKKNAYRTYKK